MPPNRDTVSAGYLQDIMTETLNAMHTKMPPESFSENWVRTAIENKRIEDEAVQTAKENRYGKRAVMWSSDVDANMRAAEAGYQVIHPKAMSAQEREVMTTKGGLQSAKVDFGRPPETQTPDTANETRTEFAKWVLQIGRVLGLQLAVQFVSAPRGTFIAQCSTSPDNPVVDNQHELLLRRVDGGTGSRPARADHPRTGARAIRYTDGARAQVGRRLRKRRRPRRRRRRPETTPVRSGASTQGQYCGSTKRRRVIHTRVRADSRGEPAGSAPRRSRRQPLNKQPAPQAARKPTERPPRPRNRG